MDEVRRERAERRRKVLAIRQKRKAEAMQAREIGRLFCERGISWVRVPAVQIFACLAGKLEAPAMDERFDWKAIPGASISSHASSGEACLQLQAAIARHAAPQSRVVLVLHTHVSGLRLAVEDLCLHLPAFIDEVPEFWIVDAEPASPWLIDYNRFDREVCHANKLV